MAITLHRRNQLDMREIDPVIESGVITSSIVSKCVNSDEIIIYLEYTKGSESQLQLQFSFTDNKIGNDKFFNDSKHDKDYIVSYRTLYIESSGSFRIPVPSSRSEDNVKLEVNLVGGQGGEVEIWVIPNNYGL